MHREEYSKLSHLLLAVRVGRYIRIFPCLESCLSFRASFLLFDKVLRQDEWNWLDGGGHRYTWNLLLLPLLLEFFLL